MRESAGGVYLRERERESAGGVYLRERALVVFI